MLVAIYFLQPECVLLFGVRPALAPFNKHNMPYIDFGSELSSAGW